MLPPSTLTRSNMTVRLNNAAGRVDTMGQNARAVRVEVLNWWIGRVFDPACRDETADQLLESAGATGADSVRETYAKARAAEARMKLRNSRTRSLPVRTLPRWSMRSTRLRPNCKPLRSSNRGSGRRRRSAVPRSTR